MEWTQELMDDNARGGPAWFVRGTNEIRITLRPVSRLDNIWDVEFAGRARVMAGNLPDPLGLQGKFSTWRHLILEVERRIQPAP